MDMSTIGIGQLMLNYNITLVGKYISLPNVYNRSDTGVSVLKYNILEGTTMTTDIFMYIISTLITITGALIGIIWKSINRRINMLATSIKENNENITKNCKESRKHIYDNYLEKELYQSEKTPIVDDINELKVTVKDGMEKLNDKFDTISDTINNNRLSIVSLESTIMNLINTMKG